VKNEEVLQPDKKESDINGRTLRRNSFTIFL